MGLSLSNLVRSCLNVKTEKESEDLAQWWSACLSLKRAWIQTSQFPNPQKIHNELKVPGLELSGKALGQHP